MTDPIFVRLAQPDDTPAIARLLAAHGHRSLEEWTDVVQRWLAGERSPDVDAHSAPEVFRVIWVATDGGTIVGYTRLAWMPCMEPEDPRCVPEGWYLLGVNVAEGHRQRGIGTALTRVRMDWLRDHGIDEVRYFRDWDNDASHALHEPFGFELECEDVWAPGLEDPDKRLVMFKASVP